jgi:hypothetical protein
MRHGVHWANALAEGQARRAMEEARENNRRTFTDKLTVGQRHCFVCMLQREL